MSIRQKLISINSVKRSKILLAVNNFRNSVLIGENLLFFVCFGLIFYLKSEGFKKLHFKFYYLIYRYLRFFLFGPKIKKKYITKQKYFWLQLLNALFGQSAEQQINTTRPF